MERSPSKKNKLLGIFLSLLVLVLILLAAIPLWHYNIFVFKQAALQIPHKIEMIKFFPFSQENALKEWEEKIFKGKVIYKIEKENNLDYVKAVSNSNASALYYKIRMNVKTRHPVVSWKWNVEKFPTKKMKESLSVESEDDFAARVYVIFPATFLLNSKVLEYVWAETIPIGTVGPSPYSNNIKLIVVRSGENADKKWFAETRDILSDYAMAFGRAPEHDIGAVAFMTNTEHTGTGAVSLYDDIRLGYKEDSEKGR